MKLLNHDAVIALIGPRSRAQIWRDIKADRFPAPIFGGRSAWVDREILSFLRWRIALRDGETEITTWAAWWALDRQRAEDESARDRPVGDAPRPESTEPLNPA